MSTLAFTKETIKAYLDRAITKARERRDELPAGREKDFNIGGINAYQNVRSSIFGELLPTENGDSAFYEPLEECT